MNSTLTPRLIPLLLVLAFALPGCDGPDPIEEANEPLSVVFDALKRSDIEGALMHYDPTFFRSTPRQQWLAQVTQIHKQKGPVVSYEILRSTSQKKTTPVSGTYVQYECKVNYQRGAALETIQLVRPDGLQHFTVSGHAITPTANEAGVQSAPLGQPAQPAPQQREPLAQPGATQPPAAPAKQ